MTAESVAARYQEKATKTKPKDASKMINDLYKRTINWQRELRAAKSKVQAANSQRQTFFGA